jgi:hypothetical protein
MSSRRSAGNTVVIDTDHHPVLTYFDSCPFRTST